MTPFKPTGPTIPRSPEGPYNKTERVLLYDQIPVGQRGDNARNMLFNLILSKG